MKSREPTYPLRSEALACPPPVKLRGRRTMNEKTDILTIQRKARRWKRRKMRASNPTRFMIFVFV